MPLAGTCIDILMYASALPSNLQTLDWGVNVCKWQTVQLIFSECRWRWERSLKHCLLREKLQLLTLKKFLMKSLDVITIVTSWCFFIISFQNKELRYQTWPINFSHKRYEMIRNKMMSEILVPQKYHLTLWNIGFLFKQHFPPI